MPRNFSIENQVGYFLWAVTRNSLTSGTMAVVASIFVEWISAGAVLELLSPPRLKVFLTWTAMGFATSLMTPAIIRWGFDLHIRLRISRARDGGSSSMNPFIFVLRFSWFITMSIAFVLSVLAAWFLVPMYYWNLMKPSAVATIIYTLFPCYLSWSFVLDTFWKMMAADEEMASKSRAESNGQRSP